MSQKSFIEVLEERIRRDIRAELEAERNEAAAASQKTRLAPLRRATSGFGSLSSSDATEAFLLRQARWEGNGLAGHAGGTSHKATLRKAYGPLASRAAEQPAGAKATRPQAEAPNEQKAATATPMSTRAPTPTPTPSRARRLPLDRGGCLVAREAFRRLGAELPELCSEREVKSAFRRLALRLHPDCNAEASPAGARAATEAFTALVEALQALLGAFAE
jgi:hypothetical protein